MSLRGQTKSVAGAGATERLLVVTSGPNNVAISATVVEGLLPPEEAGSTAFLTLRDITYPIIDLSRRLGQAPTAAPADPRIVLCGSGGRHRGFRVDQVLGLTEVEVSRLHPLPPHFAGEERAWWKGYFLYQEGVALWANPEWLVAIDPAGEPPGPIAATKRFVAEHTSQANEIIELEVVDAKRAK